jgi:hypothetical protein
VPPLPDPAPDSGEPRHGLRFLVIFKFLQFLDHTLNTPEIIFKDRLAYRLYSAIPLDLDGKPPPIHRKEDHVNKNTITLEISFVCGECFNEWSEPRSYELGASREFYKNTCPNCKHVSEYEYEGVSI